MKQKKESSTIITLIIGILVGAFIFYLCTYEPDRIYLDVDENRTYESSKEPEEIVDEETGKIYRDPSPNPIFEEDNARMEQYWAEQRKKAEQEFLNMDIDKLVLGR